VPNRNAAPIPRPRPRRYRIRYAITAAGLSALLVAAACSSAAGSDSGAASEPYGATAEIGTLPEAAQEIIEKAPYETARWLYYVADAKSGDVLLANGADQMVFTGSTAKEFIVGTVYDTLGPDTTLTTPVFSTTPVADGAVAGDLVLVASGDLALGGRNGIEGKFDHTFYAETVDHVYADVAPNADRVGDPLAGLDDLAQQVANQGVTRIDGNVVIDTSLWETFEGQEAPVPPIFVNDNILDLQVTATTEGQPATIETIPQTGYFTVESQVTTVASDGETALEVDASPEDPNTIVVSGTIAEGGSQLTIYRVDDGAAWARALFVEALQRAGVSVTAPALGPNDESGLPASDSYPADQELASLESPPLSAIGTMINQVSYNTGANAFLCLLAAESGSTDCTDGLQTVYALAEEAGVDTDDLFLLDGQGADPASTTPRQMSRWVQWAQEQPWGKVFVEGQPVLAETGSLAPYGADSPAAGKVAAKAGTSIDVDSVTGRMYSKVQSLAGYLTLDDGTELVFGLSMSGATYPQVYNGLVDAGKHVAGVAAAFQQELST
jgi:D-alanyl-D-alanine carboxypeptidase/D-alanyl-D-alanine-endopeptidase (penicillin-binding protein 4)